MAYISDISLAISIHSDRITPDQISDLAGVQPTDSHFMGDSKGRIRKGNYESHYWALYEKIKGDPLDENHTNWFSDGVIKLLQQVPADLVSQLERIDPEVGAIVWIGLFGIQDQGAFNIRADASKLLGEYKLELVFDMYIDHDSKVLGDAAWNK